MLKKVYSRISKWHYKIRNLTRFSVLLVGSYLACVMAFWGFSEPIANFAGEWLKCLLKESWWFFFYICPIPFALIISYLDYRLLNHKPCLEEFKQQTQQLIQKSNTKISGTGATIHREEVSIVEEQLNLGNSVLITGEAGTGKSGLGIFLSQRATENGKYNLIIDARLVRHLHTEIELRQQYRCEEPIAQIISNLAKEKGFLVIIDQLDNVVNDRIVNVLINFAIECKDSQSVQIVVISRKKETSEEELLGRLLKNNFVDIESRPLDDNQARKELLNLDFTNPHQELITMSKNLLNLEILSKIKTENPKFNFNEIEDEVTLWDAYFKTIQERESIESTPIAAKQMLVDAMEFAKKGLSSNNQLFIVEQSNLISSNRLESWGIIIRTEGQMYQFSHEKVQDYLYARYASDRGHLPKTIVDEIGNLKSRNAFVWVSKIYMKRNSPLQINFLEALFNE